MQIIAYPLHKTFNFLKKKEEITHTPLDFRDPSLKEFLAPSLTLTELNWFLRFVDVRRTSRHVSRMYKKLKHKVQLLGLKSKG